jgi:hypothetical protein
LSTAFAIMTATCGRTVAASARRIPTTVHPLSSAHTASGKDTVRTAIANR